MVDDSGSDTPLSNLADAAVDKIKKLDRDVDGRKAFLNKFSASVQ